MGMSAGSLGHISCTEGRKEEITLRSQETAVRCCNFAGGCWTHCETKTIYEAEAICAAKGNDNETYHLCTPNELKSGVCCGDACDGLPSWQKDKGE